MPERRYETLHETLLPPVTMTLNCLTRTLAFFLSVACLLLPVSDANAADPLEISDLRGRVELSKRIQLFEDVDGALTLDDVLARVDDFAAVGDRSPNFGFTDSAWWVRVDVSNAGDESTSALLRQDYPLIDELDLWQKSADGEWLHVATGDSRAFSSRDIQHRDFVFRVDVPAKSTRQIYLRFSSSGPVTIGLSMFDEATLIGQVGREQLGYGIYFGGFLVLLFYNLFIFVAVRDRAFFHYLLYLAFYGAYFAIHNGLTFQYFWPNSPWWGNKSLVVTLALTLIWGLRFSRSILNSDRTSPRLDRVAAAHQWLSAAGLVGAIVLPYSQIIVPLALLSALAPPLLIWMGAVSFFEGHRAARYFLVAWSMLLIGVSAYMLKTFGLLPHNFITQNGFQIGSLIEMVLLSLALASRVSELQRHSVTDGLTGVFNRRSFDEHLRGEFARNARYGQPLSLMLIDVDHFKAYNDTHGHQFGDDALRSIASLLQTNLRRTDRLCRYGGEEFVILMPDTNGEEARAIGERQREQIAAHTLSRGSLTISIGIATLSQASFGTESEFLGAADEALYNAKRGGRNRVVSHTAERSDNVTELATGT
ncbi:MAG: diguanylate cyclase [Pseudomonadota bacterium]